MRIRGSKIGKPKSLPKLNMGPEICPMLTVGKLLFPKPSGPTTEPWAH
jgi:hypothetical protein